MRWLVVTVGKLKPSPSTELCREYVTRLSRYTPAAIVEVRSADRLGGAIPPRARTVALTRTGTAWTSRQLANRLGRWKIESRDVAFLIGEADGLPASVIASADERWSLSGLTLPHELARVVVLEQLYRAETILQGEPYHRGD